METDPKNKTLQKLQTFFSNKEGVVFVYLFGSFVKKETFRDVDIAIYVQQVPDLIDQGKLQTALDNLLEHNVDLVFLNGLPAKNPTFAYEILTKGELLQCRDTDQHTNYKSRALQIYFDTAYLREQFNDAFKQRMTSNKFGERNYE